MFAAPLATRDARRDVATGGGRQPAGPSEAGIPTLTEPAVQMAAAETRPKDVTADDDASPFSSTRHRSCSRAAPAATCPPYLACAASTTRPGISTSASARWVSATRTASPSSSKTSHRSTTAASRVRRGASKTRRITPASMTRFATRQRALDSGRHCFASANDDAINAERTRHTGGARITTVQSKEKRRGDHLGVHHASGSNIEPLVELMGLEPTTPCMPCRCATSCATAPWCAGSW